MCRIFRAAQAGISGYVYSDLDNDANIDPGEGPVEGVTITLTGTPAPLKARIIASRVPGSTARSTPWRTGRPGS